MEEIEVKFLDIDVPQLEKRLGEVGAVKQFDHLYRRKVYDHPDRRLNAAAAWVRVRDEVTQVTLGFKQRLAPKGQGEDAGMEEVEVVVSDFAKTCLLLEKIGLTLKFYEENRRTRYTLGTLTFDIDTWPLLDPYLEIEAESWDQVAEGIDLLGLDPAQQKRCATMQVYERAGINELEYKELTFERQVKQDES